MSTAVHDQDRLNGSLFPNQHPPFESVSSLLPTQLATIRSPAGRSSFTTDLHATKLSLKSTRQIATIRTSFPLPAWPAHVQPAHASLPVVLPHRWSLRMSKPSVASAPKLPTPLPQKSAWARGPPISSSTPTPRSQSPAQASGSQPTTASHSRRPSTLGQAAVSFKDGVAGARSPVGATGAYVSLAARQRGCSASGVAVAQSVRAALDSGRGDL